MIDAVRTRQPTTEESRAAVADELRAAGIRGRLVFTGPRCRLRALRLPALEPARPPIGSAAACTFTLSPDGRHAVPGRAAWEADSFQYAVCSGPFVEVRIPGPGQTALSFDGCPPAFRPDGFLTVGSERGLVEVRMQCPGPPPCERVLLSRRELEAAAARHPTMPDDLRWLRRVEIVDSAWLSPRRVALLLELHFTGRLAGIGPERLVAVFDGRRLAATHVEFGHSITRLRSSPLGRYLATEPGPVLRRDGSLLELPVEGVRAVAWSPDERWTALATRASVVLVRTTELESYDVRGGSPRLLRLPLTARDLAWR